MVHNKDSVGKRVVELIESIEDDRFSDPSDVSTSPHRTATSALQVAAEVVSETKDIIEALVERAIAQGATWTEVAHALGLKNASSAHYLYGRRAGMNVPESRGVKLAAQRQRIANLRTAAPKEPMPGLSAMEAGRRLGIDRRTVKQRAVRGEIETVTVTTANGNQTVRYLVPDEPGSADRPEPGPRAGE